MGEIIYLGFAPASEPIFVAIEGEISLPIAHARYLLMEHRSCARIEIWRQDQRIAVVERAGDPGDA